MSSTTSTSTCISSASALARSSSNVTKKHVRTEPSACWQHFTATRNAQGQITFTTCNICSKAYKYKNSTTNMLAHLRTEHNIFSKSSEEERLAKETDKLYEDPSQQQLSQSSPSSSQPDQQQTIANNPIAKRKYNTQNKQQVQLMLKFLVKTNQSISLLDNEHFKAFIASISNFKTPCSKTLINHLIPRAVLDVKRQIIEELTNIHWCSITCDCWRSLANQSYIGITCHYINKEFQLVSRTLGLAYLDEIHHTGEYIHRELSTFFQKWKIDSKVLLNVCL